MDDFEEVRTIRIMKKNYLCIYVKGKKKKKTDGIFGSFGCVQSVSFF